MKTAIFVRHAKSSWDDPSLRDIDRPLNKRGFRDAPFMSKLLKGKGISVDKLVSSPANRAHTTARYFAEAFAIPPEAILIKRGIYEAYPDDILDIIQSLSKEWNTILLFGHNPTFTSLANRFADDYIANIPTCGVFRVEAGINNWQDFNQETGKLVEFLYPKQYFH